MFEVGDTGRGLRSGGMEPEGATETLEKACPVLSTTISQELKEKATLVR